jgi:hypothetical protein
VVIDVHVQRRRGCPGRMIKQATSAKLGNVKSKGRIRGARVGIIGNVNVMVLCAIAITSI